MYAFLFHCFSTMPFCGYYDYYYYYYYHYYYYYYFRNLLGLLLPQ